MARSALKNSYAVVAISLIIVILGVVSYQKMVVDIFPEINVSERYDKPDEESPIIVRRPIRLYNDKGQFLEEYNYNPVNDDPLSVWLPPGRYIVVSEANWGWRRIEVEVQDGQTTVVPESLLEQASLVSSLR